LPSSWLAHFSFAAPSGAVAQTAGKMTGKMTGKIMTTESGLQIIDGTVGTGATPKPGQICVMPLYRLAL